MAKYLFQAVYTNEGLEGLLKEGGSKRREAVEKAAKSLDGTLEAFYYAFGDIDVFAIVDLLQLRGIFFVKNQASDVMKKSGHEKMFDI